ncbi:MAG: LysE family transporter [Myxococcales bacterium]|nr:LysE family transporter [Myxococcales bacterium]
MIAASLAAGVALGVGSSLAPGPCGLAVLTATRHRQRRRALAIGVGAGLGDAACATLACAGVGTWLAGQAGSATMARVAGGAALLVCGLRARRAAGQPAPARSARSRVPGVAVGFALLVANPGAVLMWAALVAAAVAALPALAPAPLIVGVTVGTTGWYALVASALGRSRRVAQLTRGVGALLAGYGAALLCTVTA